MSRASSSVRTPRERKNRLSFSGRRPSSASNGSFQRVGIETSKLSGFGMATPRELKIYGVAASVLYGGGVPNFIRSFCCFSLFHTVMPVALDLRLVYAQSIRVTWFDLSSIRNSAVNASFRMKS